MHPYCFAWTAFAILVMLTAWNMSKLTANVKDLFGESPRKTAHIFLCAATFLAFVLSIVTTAIALLKPN